MREVFIDDLGIPELNDLRDKYVRSFSGNAVIGRLFDSEGRMIDSGQSIIDWIKESAILTRKRTEKELFPEDIRVVSMELGVAYTKICSFMSALQSASKELSSLIKSKERDMVKEELDKYVPGGEHWDEVAAKPKSRVPGKDKLASLAKASMSEVCAVLDRLNMEVAFFDKLLEGLEFQRRCIKEISERMDKDPAMRGM